MADEVTSLLIPIAYPTTDGSFPTPEITGLLIFYFNWRISFILPGMLYLLFGLWLVSTNFDEDMNETPSNHESKNKFAPRWKKAMISLILITIAGGFTFGSLTFLIPRYFDIYM